MALNRLDVLTVDATVIIGLLVLLTFSSISSSFIENESSAFTQKWHDIRNELSVADAFLDDCYILDTNRDEYEQIFLDENSRIADDGTTYSIFDRLTDDMKVKIKMKCDEVTVETLEILWKVRTLDEWGYVFSYLDQIDESEYSNYLNGESVPVFSILDSDRYDSTRIAIEGKYLHDIATGPIWINMTNLAMLFPFLISAAIACMNIIRQPNDNSDASKLAIISMGIGFVIMIIGIIIIVNGFFTVYEPFLTDL